MAEQTITSWIVHNTDELDINKFKQALETAARKRKREVMAEWLALNLGMEHEEFLKTGKDRLLETHYHDVWATLARLNLGAELIIATFGQDEALIMRIAATGSVFWEDHYSTIGSGGPIAEAFLAQRDYDDDMPLEQCLYRVYEAKLAAEKNPEVGPTTVIEILIFKHEEVKRYRLPDGYWEALNDLTEEHLRQIPKFTMSSDLLEEIENDPDLPTTKKGVS